jgi:hypothetical protein
VSAPVDIVGLAIEHRTSEDWLLRLPMRIGASDATTSLALTGAQAQLRLAGKLTTQAAAEIVFNGSFCRIEGHEIVLETASSHFENKAGVYRGDLLVRLNNGFDFVSHVIELDLKQALGWLA